MNAENTSKYQVGFTDSEVVFDGAYAKVRITITDKDAITSVLDGVTPELSAGYEVVLDSTPGIAPDGTAYHVVQRQIEGNHIALTRIGRAGPNVKPHLDSNDAVAVATFDHQPATDRMAKITINGAEFEVSEAVAVAYTTDAQTQASKLDTANTTLTAVSAERDNLKTEKEVLQGTIDELRPRVDTLVGELDALKAAPVEHKDSDAVEAAVEARLELIESARPHLDSEFVFKGKGTREIKEAVLKAVHGDSLDLSAKSEVYVDARFDSVLDLLATADHTDSQRQTVAAALRGDSKEEPSKGRSAYIARLEGACTHSTNGGN